MPRYSFLACLLLSLVPAALAAERAPAKAAATRATAGSRANETAGSERFFWGSSVGRAVVVTSDEDLLDVDAECPSLSSCTLREAVDSGASLVTFGPGVEDVTVTRGAIVILDDVVIQGSKLWRITIEQTTDADLFLIDKDDISVTISSLDLEGTASSDLIQLIEVSEVTLNVFDVSFAHASDGIDDRDGTDGCKITVKDSRFLESLDNGIDLSGSDLTLLVKGCFFGEVGGDALELEADRSTFVVSNSLLDGSGIDLNAGDTDPGPTSVLIEKCTIRNVDVDRAPVEIDQSEDYMVVVKSSLLQAEEDDEFAFEFDDTSANNVVTVLSSCYDGVEDLGTGNTFLPVKSLDTSDLSSAEARALCRKAGLSHYYKAKLEAIADDQPHARQSDTSRSADKADSDSD